MMEKVVQETINYTRQRKIFQQPVLYHQVVHFRLAELQTEIELLRSLLYRCTGGQTNQPNLLQHLQWDTPYCWCLSHHYIHIVCEYCVYILS